jgi:hypothetical protein
MKFINSYTINTFVSFFICLAAGCVISMILLFSKPEYASITYSFWCIVFYLLHIAFAIAQIVIRKLKKSNTTGSLFYNFVGTANIFSAAVFMLYLHFFSHSGYETVLIWILPAFLGLIIHADILNC